MAILRIAHSDIGRDEYDKLVAALEIATDHPVGLIMHGATELDGRMSIAQVWYSAEYAEAFAKTRLAPTLEALGIPRAREAILYELTELVTP